MFLNRLDTREKEAFVSLAIRAAEANGQIVDEEYQMIEEYCREMNIEKFDMKTALTKEDIIKLYAGSQEQNKKIVILELIGLMYADGDYDAEEKAFVEEIANGIGVSNDASKKMEKVLLKYVEMTKELMECIE